MHSSATLKNGPMPVTCSLYTQKPSGPDLRPPIQTVPGDLSPPEVGLKRSGREADRSRLVSRLRMHESLSPLP